VRTLRFGTAAWRRYVAALPRGGAVDPRVERSVASVLADVRRAGDEALVRLTKRFDGVSLTSLSLHVPPSEIRVLARRASPEIVAALRQMARRIEIYHRRQRDVGFRLPLPGGGSVVERVGPLDAVGLYVPGGAGAYPSSVLMNAIPARIAGVPRIVVVTPPRTLEANAAVAAALVIAGVEATVFRVGGAQAVAALAYGTERVPKVAKIVGPGNAYVAAAKRQVRGVVEIDHDAGPSEVVVLADDTADAGWVAADLLAQAEHGSGEETVVLVTPSARLAAEVARRVEASLASVANVAEARRALRRNGAIVLTKDLEEGIGVVNALAPEHAEVMTRRAGAVARRIVAGAVFVGEHAPVAVGDYGIGPNHVLPTGGAARYASPLSVRDFERRQSVVTMTKRGLGLVADGMTVVARAEGFLGHAQSVTTRLADDGRRGRRGGGAR
jgi:histidinol dehydrogenase